MSKRQPPIKGIRAEWNYNTHKWEQVECTYTYYRNGIGVCKPDRTYPSWYVVYVPTGELVQRHLITSKYRDACQIVDALSVLDWTHGPTSQHYRLIEDIKGEFAKSGVIHLPLI